MLRMVEKIEISTKNRFKLTSYRGPEFIFIDEIHLSQMNSNTEEECSLITSIIRQQFRKPILISFSGNYVHSIMFKFDSQTLILYTCVMNKQTSDDSWLLDPKIH